MEFFQGKKLRGAMQRAALDMLAGTVELRPPDLAALREAVARAPLAEDRASPAGRAAPGSGAI